MESNFDMSLFIKDMTETSGPVEVPGIDSFKYPKGHEKEGEIIPWVVTVTPMPTFQAIGKRNTTTKIVGGKQISNQDDERVMQELMVESIIFPDFKNPEWLAKNNFIDPVDLLKKVLAKPGDYVNMSKHVTQVNGLAEDIIEEEVEEIKNS